VKRLVLILGLIALPAVASAQQPEAVEYYATDGIGSIRIVYDANGNVIGRQDYMPFGTPVLNGASMPREGFGGNEKDNETQQMYFHARLLSGSIGRFSRVDPWPGNVEDPQQLNRYAYALNRPTIVVDPHGLLPIPPDISFWLCRILQNGPCYGSVANTLPPDPFHPQPRLPGLPAPPRAGPPGRLPPPGTSPKPTPEPGPNSDPAPKCDPVSGENCDPSVNKARLNGFIEGATGTCAFLFAKEALSNTFGPGSWPSSETAQDASQVAVFARMNAALQHAASARNVLKTPGLLYPFKSSVFRVMFTDAMRLAGATGSLLIAADIGIYQALGTEYQAAVRGDCK
jgi:RHS repeat-associated protein